MSKRNLSGCQRQSRLNALKELREWRDRCLKCDNVGRLRVELLSHCVRVTTGYVGGYVRCQAECTTCDDSIFCAFGETELHAAKSLTVKVYKYCKTQT